MVKLLPKYSPFAASPSLSVVSYNLLAPLYVRPIDSRTGGIQAFAAFQWAEPADEVLTWQVRRPRLHSQLVSSKADVICLQEVQFDAGDDGFSLPEWLRLEGYDFRVPPSKELQQIADERAQELENAEKRLTQERLVNEQKLRNAQAVAISDVQASAEQQVSTGASV